MIPIIGSAGWFFMPLRPTKFVPAMIAKIHVVDDRIVSAFARQPSPYPNAPGATPHRRLHWTAGFGSWIEVA